MKSVAVKSSPAKTKAKPASVKARPAKTAAAKPAAKRVVAKAPAKKAVVSKAAPAKAKPAGAKPPVKAKVKAAAPVKAKAPAGKAAAPRSAPVKTAPAKTAAPKKTAPVKVAVAAPKKAALSPKPAAPLPKSLPRPLAAAPVAHVAVRKNPKLANNWKTKPVEQWSDAEVIAMPDDEYMNEPQRAFFRLKLLALRNGILDNAGQTAENLRDDTAVVPDPADRATIEEEHALELRTRDRERKLLKKIEQSIARIDSGDYGYCDETGEPIGVPRLLARPTATLSLEAQQRRELKQKMFGD